MILDQELDQFYEKILLPCLEATFVLPMNQKRLPTIDPTLENEINHLLTQAQEAEQKHDGSAAIRLYLEVNAKQCQFHRYLDAVQTMNKIQALRKTYQSEQ